MITGWPAIFLLQELMMLYRELPKTKESLSILGFGCMRLPGKQIKPDEDKSIELIRDAINKGINYFDTAWPYHNGKSEVILGKALNNGFREKVKIADKLPPWLCHEEKDMDFYLNEQLKRLGVDYIDYYLLHALDGETWDRLKGINVIDFMERAKKTGKIKNAGFSFHGDREDFKKIIDAYDWDFCQIQFNILDDKNQAGIEGLEYAYSKNIGVIIMEPLRGGILAGKLPKEIEKLYNNAKNKRTNVEWALRWIWDHPGVITVLSGMNTLDQLEENVKIASEAKANSLTHDEKDLINEVAAKFMELMRVPCTGCQYCMPCPKNVNIPSAFSFYNQKYLFKNGFMSRILYFMQNTDLGSGRKSSLASQCVNCGLCLKHCPQKIEIPSELKKVKKSFEGITTKPLLFLVKKIMGSNKKKKTSNK